jgi:hypothetical protein
MARGGAGAKVRPSLAEMGGAPARTGRQTRAAGDQPLPYEPVQRARSQRGPAGRERSQRGQPPYPAAAPAEARRPPTPLKAPRPLAVEAEEGPDGPAPQWVTWRGTRRAVATVEDDWRVDDEWWRDEVSRHYFAVTLADGCRLTLFFDRIAGTWWEQSC